MKKYKIIHVLSVVLFLLFVIATPIIGAFIPYREPIIPNETLEVVSVDDTQAIVYGELQNPTLITISELEIHVAFYDAEENWISTRKVVVELETVFGPGASGEFMGLFTINSAEANAEYYACTDIYYTYTKPGWYLFLIGGLVVYFIFTIFVSKQKYYFEIDGNKFEVYVGGNKVAIIKEGELITEQSLQSAFTTPTTFEFNEKKLTVNLKRKFLAPCPQATIKYDGQDVEITGHKQHVFLKVIDKKKEMI